MTALLMLWVLGTRVIVETPADPTHKIHRSYSHVPYVALDVDRAALGRLLRSSGKIYLDHTYEPTLQESLPIVAADNVHAAGIEGQGQVLALIDTGVDRTHPALAGRVIAEACFSDVCPNGQKTMIGDGAAVPCSVNPKCQHGTHMAGIMAAMAPAADLVAIRVFSDSGQAHMSDIIAAFEWLAGLTLPVGAVNLSLAGGVFPGICDEPERPLKDAIDLTNIVAVASSGNGGLLEQMGSPACLSNVVSVGCTSDIDTVCSLSNSGDSLDLLAPGAFIRSTVPGGGYRTQSGTSASTAHVTGAYALLDPWLDPAEALDSLKVEGDLVVDHRQGRITPRLQVARATGAQPTCSDADFDNEVDATDLCPGTLPGRPVDSAGCSQLQFCASFDARSSFGARACKSADWMNDGTARNPQDCWVERGSHGRSDDLCVGGY